MEAHYQLSDQEFVYQFENIILDPKLFSHEAHLRIAWIYIKNNNIDYAIAQLREQLIKFVTHLGAREKYNETVTVAAVKAVYHFYLKSNSENFKSFIEEFPRLKTNFKDLLVQHYNIDVFNSEMAKSSFLEPDKLPFN